MRNLFRSGAVFMIIAGIAFVAAAVTGVKYLVSGNGSATSPIAALATAVWLLVVGIVVKSKNAK